jgi:SEC-C motif-containing protein
MMAVSYRGDRLATVKKTSFKVQDAVQDAIQHAARSANTSGAIATTINPSLCPCGSSLDYQNCCGRFHKGEVASTAEQLMRARYSAYTLHDDAYIAATWHPSTSPLPEALVNSDPLVSWRGLEVRRYESTGDQATVEFIARYKLNGRAQRIHEISRFLREAGQWWYLDGSFPQTGKS